MTFVSSLHQIKIQITLWTVNLQSLCKGQWDHLRPRKKGLGRVGVGPVGLRSCWSVASTCSHLPPFVSIWLVSMLFSQTVTIVAKSDLVFQFHKATFTNVTHIRSYLVLAVKKNICLRTCHSSKCDWKREQHVTSNKLVKKNIDPLQKFKLLVGHMWSRVYPILKQVRFEIPWDSVCQVNRLQPKTFISLSFVVNRSTDIQKGKADGHLAQKKLWFLVVIL